ncbi:sugar-binding transcriptional regulator [Salmonella enterica]|uniref:Transcriptional regulator LsrR n=2 Tax=Salmonella enterica TaxID=28901 RepID=A0A5Y6I2W5_SALER|nr:sugar-binding transcriptional regulator [Salmonella enterica]EAA3226485.1 sugar-binding transcriptional regulator [Salmonella enterica subsp. enterica serovar Newport]EAA8761911.1 sugar-binding transcriptional regulator [Salmonella enterica subsp. enterica serovar Rubislaw]EBV1877665.1 sugar-binding transcriptional regulator [Salmonella enterica subsp. enterica serovar Adelaide]EBW8395753.1 sugar-binding transcriptional regulator [Salmonella enterica subsp. enterica serovar Florida]ECC99399
MDKPIVSQEYELLTEIAVAYYCDEITQEEIANKFGLSRIKVGRLLKRAKEEGIVEINVRYHPVFSTQLEKQLKERFPVSRALIALDHHDEEEQRRQVASLVSAYLNNVLKDNVVVAVGQGRNVASVAESSGVIQGRDCRFICGIGGTHRPGDVINADHISRLLAKKFGGSSESLYAPAYVENIQLKELLLQNGTIKETLDRARKADIALVGIGDMNEESYMVKLGWFTPHEINDASLNQGVIGDIAGYDFFNARGEHVNTVMDNRVIGLSVEELRQIPCVIAIASENTKAMAIMGALRTGAIDIIATSARNIRTILNLSQ